MYFAQNTAHLAHGKVIMMSKTNKAQKSTYNHPKMVGETNTDNYNALKHKHNYKNIHTHTHNRFTALL